jgi:hypothetical protein
VKRPTLLLQALIVLGIGLALGVFVAAQYGPGVGPPSLVHFAPGLHHSPPPEWAQWDERQREQWQEARRREAKEQEETARRNLKEAQERQAKDWKERHEKCLRGEIPNGPDVITGEYAC